MNAATARKRVPYVMTDEDFELVSKRIRFIACYLRRKVPSSFELDDMISEGWVGALRAVPLFDPTLGVSFVTYASNRIRGTILDYMRSEDPLSRSHRQAVKKGEACSIGTYSLDLRVGLALDDPMYKQVIARTTIAELLHKSGLDARRKSAVQLYYLEEILMRDVGRALNVNQSRASVLVAEALTKLRAV